MKHLRDQILSSKSISVRGNGTRGGKGDLQYKGADVLEYSPDELYVTVESGMSISALEELLDKHEQMLPFEPMDMRAILGTKGAPTIGGALGVNADGPRRLRYGSMRDAVLGLEFIDGEGEHIRAGGKVMKNVTGLDLTKFFVGSRGRLGVATRLTMKLLPKPKQMICLKVGADPKDLNALIWPALRRPLDIVAASYHHGYAYLRLEGLELSSSRRELENMIGKCEEGGDWSSLRDWAMLADAEEIWRIYTRASLSSEWAERFEARALVQIGGSQVIIAASVEEVEKHLRAGEFAICEKGQLRGERIPKRNPLEGEIMSKLAQVFDPKQKFGGIL